MFPHFLVAIADLTHPLSNNRSSVRVIGCLKLMMSHFEEQTKMMEKRLTSLEHGARQPRLAMEADGHANTKTQERTVGATTAVQAMRGDSCTTAQRVQYSPMTNSTSFGVKTESHALPCRDDVVVESGDAATRS